MILKYVKIEEDWDDLKDGSLIKFDLPTEEIKYKIAHIITWWLRTANSDNNNSRIFDVLEIEDPDSFVETIIEYKAIGNFPEVKSLDDLKKVIIALDTECVKKFGTPDSKSKSELKPKFKVGDKVRILPRKGFVTDYSFGYIDAMLEEVGKIATIINCEKSSFDLYSCPDDGYKYKLDIDDKVYTWTSSMLELVENSDSKEEYIHPSKLKNGDFIKIRTGDRKGLIYIFKEYKDNSIYRYVSLDLVDNSLDTDSSRKWGIFSSSDKITYATKEESKLLLEALAKKGYYWYSGANALVPVETITLAKSISVDTVQNSPTITKACSIKTSTIEEHSDELNLFPTKKHYQLNFNY